MMADCFLKQECSNWKFNMVRTPVIIGVEAHSMIAKGNIRNLGRSVMLANGHKYSYKTENVES